MTAASSRQWGTRLKSGFLSMATIDNNTKINLAMAASIVLFMVAAVVYGDRRVTALENAVKQSFGDRYTISAASEQALRMALENPGLSVPDPRNTAMMIRVDKSRMYVPGTTGTGTTRNND